jgi:NADPH:quinone reductase-like Zn-dependent oxidoreductase
MDARAVIIDGYDGPQSLRVAPVDVPAPSGGQIRVRVTAAGVGPWDFLTTEGAFAEVLGDAGHAAFPMVLGWDFAGVVADAGPGSDLRPGERVFGMTRQPIDGVGCHAELVTLAAERCARVPDEVSDEDAASLPCCGLTAWQALDHAGVRAGDTLLVIGATGQLGGLVSQLAAGRGVRVIASVSSAQAETARRFGAAETVDRDGDLAEQVRAIAAHGVDAAFDPVGVPVAPALRDGGRFVRAVTWSPEVTERGITTHTLFVEDDREGLRRLGAMLERGALTARVGEVFPLGEAGRAYDAVKAGGTGGKVILDPAR